MPETNIHPDITCQCSRCRLSRIYTETIRILIDPNSKIDNATSDKIFDQLSELGDIISTVPRYGHELKESE